MAAKAKFSHEALRDRGADYRRARRRDRLEEALGAVDVELDEEAQAAIERAVPKRAAAGERYDARQMAILDSERS